MQIGSNDLVYMRCLKAVMENPSYLSDVGFLEHALNDELYVIYFYIKELGKRKSKKLRLTRSYLETSLKTNAHKWLNPRSILREKSSIISKDYIQSRFLDVKNLLNEDDYKDGFCSIVLSKFDEIEILNIFDLDIEVIILETKGLAQVDMAKNLINNMVDIFNNPNLPLRVNKKIYQREEMISFMQDKLREYSTALIAEDSASNYKDFIDRIIEENSSYGSPIFKWDLGKVNIPVINPGFLLYLLGAPKAGKTRFSIGEIAYPALMQGKNVKYITGEVQPDELIAAILNKHIYKMYNKKLKEDHVGLMLKLDTIPDEKLTHENREALEEINLEARELIRLAKQDLFGNETYGKLIPSMEDNNLVLEDMFDLALSSIEKDDIDLIIYDHAGLFSSRESKNSSEVVTQVIKTCKKIARNSTKPIGVVCINHIKTSEVQSVLDGDYDNVEGHNSSEGRKSANALFVLAANDEEKKEGLVRLVVALARKTANGKQMNNEVIMLLDEKSHCEYSSV